MESFAGARAEGIELVQKLHFFFEDYVDLLNFYKNYGVDMYLKKYTESYFLHH